VNGFYLENMESCKDELTNEELFIEKAKYPDRIREYNNRIFNCNVGLVRTIVNKYVSNLDTFCLAYSITKDEVYELGFYGLMKAINLFDVTKGFKFATYASRCIINEINIFVRRNKKHKNYISLEQSLHEDEDGNVLTLSDVLLNNDTSNEVEDNYLKLEEIEMLNDLKNTLSATDYQIIKMAFFENKTQKEIASKLGLYQAFISRKLQKIYKKLRIEFMKQGIYQR